MKIKLDSLFKKLSLIMPFGTDRMKVNILRRELNDGEIDSVLDIGCGCGGFGIFREFNSTGCDIFDKSLEVAKENGNYKTLFKLDIRNMPFEPKSFDAVTLLDVVEHLNKDESMKLVNNAERIARKKVIIITPWGYDSSRRGGDFSKENPLLEHQCGWYPEEFQKRSYRTHPLWATKWRYGNMYFAIVFNYILAIVFRPILMLFPTKFCWSFSAVKELR